MASEIELKEFYKSGITIVQGNTICCFGNTGQIEITYSDNEGNLNRLILHPNALSELLLKFSVARDESGLNGVVDFSSDIV